MICFVGIDGGGTKLRVRAESDDGKLLFDQTAGPANWASMGPGVIEERLRQAISGCPAPVGVCGCFAGLLGEIDRQECAQMIARLFPNAKALALPDYRAILAIAGKETCCVIAGTGALVCTQTNGGISKLSGGGPLLGDDGSAFAIGRSALRLLLADQLPAALCDVIKQDIGSLRHDDVLRDIYAAESPPARIAALARGIICMAEKHRNSCAIQIVKEQAAALALRVRQHLTANKQKARKIVMAGGLFESSQYYCSLFEEVLRETGVLLRCEKLASEPVIGAVRLAREI